MSPTLSFYYFYSSSLFTPIDSSFFSLRILTATVDKSLGRDKWNDTYYPTSADAAAIHKRWYIVDAEGQTLGRLATLVTDTIRGKNSVGYTPSMDMGSFVIVINAEKVAVTGSKELNKTYFRHTTGRPGGGKIEALRDLRVRIPERIIEKAVRGMLPTGRIGNSLYTHLKVYKGASHPHAAQKPVDITHNISKKPAELTPL
jgi:large subunit ribosomal protein L13